MEKSCKEIELYNDLITNNDPLTKCIVVDLRDKTCYEPNKEMVISFLGRFQSIGLLKKAIILGQLSDNKILSSKLEDLLDKKAISCISLEVQINSLVDSSWNINKRDYNPFMRPSEYLDNEKYIEDKEKKLEKRMNKPFNHYKKEKIFYNKSQYKIKTNNQKRQRNYDKSKWNTCKVK